MENPRFHYQYRLSPGKIMVVFQKFSIYIIYTCNVYVNSYRGLYYTLRIKGLKDYKESCIIYIYNAKFIFISTPEINQHPHSKFLLAILRWLGPSLLIDMGGHLVLNILNNTLLENPNFGFKTNGNPMENQWNNNGFKAFLVLNPMNPIERPMDSKHFWS